jgi:hypothetical protein
MIITGIKRSNGNITLYTNEEIISFDSYKSDTPQKIISELIEEGFKIINLNYLEKLLKIVLYSRFTSIINNL